MVLHGLGCGPQVISDALVSVTGHHNQIDSMNTRIVDDFMGGCMGAERHLCFRIRDTSSLDLGLQLGCRFSCKLSSLYTGVVTSVSLTFFGRTTMTFSPALNAGNGG